MGGKAQAMALLVLACAAGGAGALWQGRDLHEMVIEREVTGDTSGDATVGSRDSADEGKGGDVSQEVPQAEAEHFVVHVDGAVGKPGVVELTGTDLRVFDAVSLAGGLLDDADTTQVNLAEPLSDGAKIHIPHEGELTEQSEQVVSGQAQTSGATGSGEAMLLVNINTATSEELQTLSGVGEATAKAIIEERERGGPFATPEDLMRVSGIGEKKFAKVKDSICV